MALSIAAVGEIVEDYYVEQDLRLLGGISCNFARSAAAADVTLFSAVGDDDAGQRLLAALSNRSAVRVMHGRTAEQRIRLRGGDREFCGFDAGVLQSYALTTEELAQARACDVVHVPMQPETEHLLTPLLGHPALVADFSIDSATGDDPRTWCGPHLDQLRIAFIGGHKRQLEALLSLRTQTLIVLTCGADGAYALHAGKALHQPTVATQVVDTTGCGDALAGAFTVAYFTGASLADALAAGAARAALVASRVGA